MRTASSYKNDMSTTDGPTPYLRFLQDVARDDVAALIHAEKQYGDSWKKRGGIGAFMMLARKWDRLERFTTTQSTPYDIFSAVESDSRPEGIIDDIRDLRRYLLLVEAELLSRGTCPALLPKDRQSPPSAE